MIRALVLTVAILASAGCAVLRPLTPPILNPNLGVVGKVAVRAAGVVNAIDIGQRQIEPLVDAEVLTAAEGLAVIRALGVALEQAKTLVAILAVADAALTVTEHLQKMREASAQAKALLKTMGQTGVGISGYVGRVVVANIAGSVTDAVGDLVPAGGGQ